MILSAFFRPRLSKTHESAFFISVTLAKDLLVRLVGAKRLEIGLHSWMQTISLSLLQSRKLSHVANASMLMLSFSERDFSTTSQES